MDLTMNKTNIRYTMPESIGGAMLMLYITRITKKKFV